MFLRAPGHSTQCFHRVPYECSLLGKASWEPGLAYSVFRYQDREPRQVTNRNPGLGTPSPEGAKRPSRGVCNLSGLGTSGCSKPEHDLHCGPKLVEIAPGDSASVSYVVRWQDLELSGGKRLKSFGASDLARWAYQGGT